MIQMRVEIYLDMPVYRALEAKATKVAQNPVVYIRDILNEAAEAKDEISKIFSGKMSSPSPVSGLKGRKSRKS
ncbi:MAG: hypothetical protein EXS63_05425 [Candidatus Omnitrophica bacterium]|nr:hypothetical protein [Candidatus Omnitrophota bacterium]